MKCMQPISETYVPSSEGVSLSQDIHKGEDQCCGATSGLFWSGSAPSVVKLTKFVNLMNFNQNLKKYYFI